VTTTRNKLHNENETRLLSLDVDESAEQTRKVLRKIAVVKGFNRVPAEADLKPWGDYQRFLAAGNCTVVVPFAATLSRLIPEKAMSSVRLRRDFSQVLIAIKAHALLHHEHRRRRDDDSIVATIEEDYAEVYGLMADLVATASEQKIRKAMAETVAAVEKLAARLHDEDGVSVRAIANALKLDRSATYRRLSAAEDAGYVVNLAERRGQAGKYRTTGQEPSIGEVLPTVDALQEAREADQAARKDSRNTQENARTRATGKPSL